MKLKKGNKGFTLVEIIIVLQIIFLLALILIPVMVSAIQKSRQRTTMAEMRTIGTALGTYRIDSNYFPAGVDITQLEAILTPEYMAVLNTQDGWNRHFSYSGTPNSYSIESFGRDGVDGMNITSHTSDVWDLDIMLSNGSFSASPLS